METKQQQQKNLFLLSTNKQSRLHVDLRSTFLTPNYQIGKEINSVVDSINIYITSDEEIKEGDWVIDDYAKINLVQKVRKCDFDSLHYKNGNWKKIILTTDQDLIKDGVQAIEDEFLEWFVKNPSCEEVEIETYFKKIGVETDANGYREMNVLGKDYKIIIPKEEYKNKELYDDLVDLLERLRPIYKEVTDLHWKYEQKRLDLIELLKKK